MTVHWLALPDDGRECPLLCVNEWGQPTHDAGLFVTTEGDSITACWSYPSKQSGLPIPVQWGRALWVPIPPRTRRARLMEIMQDEEINRLLATVCDGWTLGRDELFGIACGTLDEQACAALRDLRARVQAIACAPARLRTAPAQAAAQPC
jgi:hypothetical protein